MSPNLDIARRSALALWAFSSLPAVAWASAPVDTVLDVDFEQLNFVDPVLVSGTDLAVGAVYRYTNVGTFDEIQVDAFLTVEAASNCTLGVIDGTTNPHRFEPTIRCTSSGRVSFLMAFVGVDDAPIALTNFSMTGVDIDGSSSYQETQEIVGFSKYYVNDPNLMTISVLGDGYTRFRGRNSNLDGIPFDDTCSYIAEYTAWTSEVRFRMGATANTSSQFRLFSVGFGAPEGTFTTPLATLAPDVALTVEAFAVAVPVFEVTAAFSEVVTGLTESDILVENGSVEPGSLSTEDGITYTFTVVADGDGIVLIQIPGGAAKSDDSGIASTPSNTVEVLIDTLPPDTFIVDGPVALSASTTAFFVLDSDESPVTYECSLDDAAFTDCDVEPEFVGLSEGPHTLRARAIDLAGNVDPTPAEHTWTIDVTPPNTFIVEGPLASTTSTTASFVLDSDESPVTYECSLDDAAFVACDVEPEFDDLAEGPHVLRARAIDEAGVVDPTPAEHTWTVDVTAPDTFIVEGPLASTTLTTAFFVFDSDESPVSYECSLNDAAFEACDAEHVIENVPRGPHTLRVRAIDDAGNVDPTPAEHDWTVIEDPSVSDGATHYRGGCACSSTGGAFSWVSLLALLPLVARRRRG
jgi:hypothetical protein